MFQREFGASTILVTVALGGIFIGALFAGALSWFISQKACSERSNNILELSTKQVTRINAKLDDIETKINRLVEKIEELESPVNGPGVSQDTLQARMDFLRSLNVDKR